MASDRRGLSRLCAYGARGALALSRLSELSDGRFAYAMKRPLPDGRSTMVMTGVELLKKLVPLVPPAYANLTRFHGVFALTSRLRAKTVPLPKIEAAREASSSPSSPAMKAREVRVRGLHEGRELLEQVHAGHSETRSSVTERTLYVVGEAAVGELAQPRQRQRATRAIRAQAPQTSTMHVVLTSPRIRRK